MPVRMQNRNADGTTTEAEQLCARGWQDYMLETDHFQFDAAVAECLRDLAPALRKHLGLAPLAVEPMARELKFAA